MTKIAKENKNSGDILNSDKEKVENDFKSPFDPICDKFAQNFDDAYDLNDIEKTEKLVDDAKKLLKENITPEYAHLFYSVGTSLVFLRDNLINELESKLEQRYLNVKVIKLHEEALYYLREAEDLVNKIELTSDNESYIIGFQMILYVNLGNALDFCGRECMALLYYRKALELGPFVMTYGNIGRVLEHYAFLESDIRHRSVLLKEAYKYYIRAEGCDDQNIYNKAKTNFRLRREMMEKKCGKDKLLSQTECSAVESDSEEEISYRVWCNNNHLFLNTLNDLTECNDSFMHDVLQIESITSSVDQTDPPFVLEMFNQIKEEFIYARFLIYEVYTTEGKVHFADKNTHLSDMLNNNCYSIRIEKLKTAYRTLYSIFDRISFLLNYYLNLGIEERKVSFKNIWSNIKEKEANNIAIYALHWLYRDFQNEFENKPYSKEIKDLRNALEHKFVSINSDDNEHEIKMGNDFIYHISELELKKYTLDLAKMIREAIIQLIIAIRIEEMNNSSKEEIILKIPITEYPDEYKN